MNCDQSLHSLQRVNFWIEGMEHALLDWSFLHSLNTRVTEFWRCSNSALTAGILVVCHVLPCRFWDNFFPNSVPIWGPVSSPIDDCLGTLSEPTERRCRCSQRTCLLPFRCANLDRNELGRLIEFRSCPSYCSWSQDNRVAGKGRTISSVHENLDGVRTMNIPRCHLNCEQEYSFKTMCNSSGEPGVGSCMVWVLGSEVQRSYKFSSV